MGSVAGGSAAHVTMSNASALHTRATRPIMRPVQASASLRDVTVVLDDRPILRDVTLEIQPGLTLVRGPNGGGKTTLLRAIAGLVPLARGVRRLVGDALYIGHRPMLLRGLTARENLSFYARFRGLASDGVATALGVWGLAGAMDRPVEELSAGERRRASLARIETERVPVLLLDEPFTELDEAGVARLRDAIGRARGDGRTVVVATHAHHELDELSASRITVANGLAIADGVATA
jgi:heme exporter protein A